MPIDQPECAFLSNLLMAAARQILKKGPNDDLHQAGVHIIRFLVDVVEGRLIFDFVILAKILEVFCIKYTAIELELSEKAATMVLRFLLQLAEAKSYNAAITLMEKLSFREYNHSLLYEILEKKDHGAAKRLAVLTGCSMQRELVRAYVKLDNFNQAYEVARDFDLLDEFSEVKQMGLESEVCSKIKKLAKKGSWEEAELMAESVRRRLESLVDVAIEEDCERMVKKLGDNHSVRDYVAAKAYAPIKYLRLHELMSEAVIFVDNREGLEEATCQIEASQVIGIDTEWQPSYKKGIINKVSIMQIASHTRAFIIDLIKLARDAPDTLNSCLIRILHSQKILKLGYDCGNDMSQLSKSYRELECFKCCQMVLDLQEVVNERLGGLSGLTKKVLGTPLNKTCRKSEWEDRPLSPQQLEYAALDAAVLIRIFEYIRSQPQMTWESHIISHGTGSAKMEKLINSLKESGF